MKVLREVRAYLVWSMTPMLLLVAADAHQRALAGPLGPVIALAVTLALALTIAALWLRLRNETRVQDPAANDPAANESLQALQRHPEQFTHLLDAAKSKAHASPFYSVASHAQMTVVFQVKEGDKGSRRIVSVQSVQPKSRSASTWVTLVEPIKLYGQLLQDLPEHRHWEQTTK